MKVSTFDSRAEANHYNVAYLRPEYWPYRRWLYYPFIRALVAKGKLSQGASVLDAGCGQGFFTGLFAELGFKAMGVDLSATGITSARAHYGSTGAVFEVGDVLALPHRETFDCVFTRSLGPYSAADFESNRVVTEALLEHVKPGGLFIFDYYTRLKRKMESPDWRHHSMRSVRKHFESYPTARVYFSLRFDTVLLGKMTFCAPLMAANCLVSKITGLGGEALALVRKEPAIRTFSTWRRCVNKLKAILLPTLLTQGFIDIQLIDHISSYAVVFLSI